jgi:uncharacterized membrane protein YfcA
LDFPSLSLLLPAALILFFGAFVRSALGFGDAVVAMPLLALVLGITTATPLVALVASTIALSILIKNWRKADFHATWRLIVASFAGIPIGLLFLTEVPETYLKLCLGILITGYGMYRILKPALSIGRAPLPAFLFGFFAGVLGGAYNTHGPPVVIYGTLRRWSPQDFRATLQGYFLPTGLMIAAGHGAAGLWTATVAKLYLLCLPCVGLGIFLGGKVNRSIRGDLFLSIINFVLIGLGLLLIFRAVTAG